MKLLFVGAHPADLIDLAAGTIANHIEAGDEVFIMAVTLGVFSHPLSKEQMSNIGEFERAKIDECQDALDVLDVKKENRSFLGFDDGIFFDPGILHRKPIAEIISKVRPDVLVTHHPAESHHPDHSYIGQQSMEASVAAGRYVEMEGFEPCRVSNVFFYGYQFHPNMVKLGRNVVPPDVVVDITKVIEKKAVAFISMPSQYNTKDVVWSRLNSMEKEWGRQYGFEYAETFISYQPCRTTLLPDFGSSDFQSLLRRQAKK
ncbi:MAG: PIG-L family deacetylase [Pseudomonadota bacterium]